MTSAIATFFGSQSFMPHGHCYLWRPDILWLNVIPDAVIAASYFSIPLCLLVFMRRKSLPFNWIVRMFAAFILACGVTHVVEIWTTWMPNYGVQGLVKLVTAGVSAATAALLWPLLPRALALPSTAELAAANQKLKDAQAETEARVVERTTELAASEQMFRTLANSIPQLCWMADATGNPFWFNERWFEYTGLTREQMASDQRQELQHPDHKSRVQASFKKALATGTPWEETFPLRSSRGDWRWFLTRALPIRDHEGKVTKWFGTNTDVTTQREAESVLKNMNERLERHVDERTTQLKAVNSELEAFCYSVSHDLRAPLRSIAGFSQALCDDYADSLEPTAKNYLNRIEASALRMSQLIDDLLELSRVSRTSLRRDQVDISLTANAVISELRSQDPKRVVDVQIEAGLTATGDERLLRLVVQNLVGNAWKFTSKRSSAHIEVRRLDPDDPSHDLLLFRDDGAGFDMAHAERLFGTFQRLHSNAEFAGTGVGLAIVDRIVRRHGGQIWAEAKSGEGASFFLKLPRVGDQS